METTPIGSPDLPHGENNHSVEQWYMKDRQRYKDELEKMLVELPHFSHSFDEEKNAYWEGEVVVNKVSTPTISYLPHYSKIKVRIVCPHNYPDAFPRVIDTERLLLSKCPHIYRDTYALCYAFGAESELDFINKHSIVDLYSVTQLFIIKQSIYEETGLWPDGQFHAESAFVYREYLHGPIDPLTACYCNQYGLQYKDCHMKKVEALIYKINLNLREKLGKRKIGPNSKCVCQSGKKFKKCCEKKYLQVSRNHFIQLYPELDKVNIKRIFEEIDEEFNKNYLEQSP